MINLGYVKKSTFILTITVLTILFVSSIIFVIHYYKNKNITVNIPTVVEDENSNNILANFFILED